MSFPCYPEYKDSGVEWLGAVPEHWQVLPLKRDIAFLTSGSRGWAEHYSDEGALFLRIGNLTRDGIGLDLSDIQRVDVPEGTEGARTQVQQGDVLFSITAYLGSVAVVPAGLETAYVSQHVALARLRKDLFLPEWVAYVVSSWIGKTYLETQGYGGTKVQLSLEDVANTLVTAPPLPEQLAIATFIRYETAKLDNLMAEQEKLIALLKEKRQAVIAHAVTKGLDSTVSMKDSGVEWLGEVPAHWTVISLGRVTQEKCDGPFGSGLKSEHYTESGVRVIRLQNIRQHGFDGSDEAFIDAEYYQSTLAGRDVVTGDVLIAGLGDERNTVGRACVAPDDISPAMVKADCFRFRLFTEIAVPAFVARQLSVSASADAGAFATGTTRSRIPLTVMATRKVSLPPAKEQQEIVSWIEQEMVKLDALCAECQQAIDLLKERRTALISAAVTGQIDVRGLIKDKQEQAA